MERDTLLALVRVVPREFALLRKRRITKTIEFQGISIRIDRPQGFVQRGRDEEGKTWERTYKVDYGYIPRTRGGDGDGLDVYLGPEQSAQLAYWVNQRKANGDFDEYKLMLGFPDRRSARAMWAAHTPERFYGGIASTSVGVIKALLGLEPQAIGKAIHAMVEDRPCSDAEAQAERAVKLLKAEDRGELRYVMGVVLEPDIVDSQGDTYDAETIRKAAWLYLSEFRNRGLQHLQLVNHAVELVESWIAPVDFELGSVAIKAGTWLAGFHIRDDGLWAAVKAGEFTGFSIGGVSLKVDPETGKPLPPPPDEARGVFE